MDDNMEQNSVTKPQTDTALSVPHVNTAALLSLWPNCQEDREARHLIERELRLLSPGTCGSAAADCVLLNRGLSAFFGELVKYNCVILYKAVLK